MSSNGMRMTSIDIRPNLDTAPLEDVLTSPAQALHGTVTLLGLLPNGTSGGKASVAMVITLDDGKQVIAETTWRVFNSAARALAASPVAQAPANRS